MAVTLTNAEILAQLRLGPGPAGLSGEGRDAILVVDNDPVALLPARAAWASAEVVRRTVDDCPDDVHNMAVLALVGYLYDAPPSAAGGGYAHAWANSGAVFILRPYLHRRAVEIGGAAS